MLDSSGSSEALRWNLINAWPDDYFGTPLNASCDLPIEGFEIEKLVMAHEGLQRADG
jgi:hypothetical protein